MVGHLLERHGVALADAALADLVAVAVEEGDGDSRPCERQSVWVASKAGRASASISTAPPVPSVRPSPRISTSARVKPVTRKRRMKREKPSTLPPRNFPARKSPVSTQESMSISRSFRRRFWVFWNGSRKGPREDSEGERRSTGFRPNRRGRQGLHDQPPSRQPSSAKRVISPKPRRRDFLHAVNSRSRLWLASVCYRQLSGRASEAERLLECAKMRHLNTVGRRSSVYERLKGKPR